MSPRIEIIIGYRHRTMAPTRQSNPSPIKPKRARVILQKVGDKPRVTGIAPGPKQAAALAKAKPTAEPDQET